MVQYRLVHFLFLCILVTGAIPGGDARGGTNPSYTRTVEQYTIPDVTLINQDGAKVSLRKALLCDKPVLVDFIYTTCTTICPVLSANFINFQRKLGPESSTAQLVSISIDPENDTPKAMKTYLRKFQAKPGWDFLTGSRQDINAVIKAFRALNVYNQNKMEHYPLIILKSAADDRWVRIYGMIGTTELIKEFEAVRK
jgi:protein SCO1